MSVFILLMSAYSLILQNLIRTGFWILGGERSVS